MVREPWGITPEQVEIEVHGGAYVGVGYPAGLRAAVFLGLAKRGRPVPTREQAAASILQHWHDVMSELYGICDICDLHYVLGDATDHNPETGNHHECEAGIIRLGFV